MHVSVHHSKIKKTQVGNSICQEIVTRVKILHYLGLDFYLLYKISNIFWKSSINISFNYPIINKTIRKTGTDMKLWLWNILQCGINIFPHTINRSNVPFQDKYGSTFILYIFMISFFPVKLFEHFINNILRMYKKIPLGKITFLRINK